MKTTRLLFLEQDSVLASPFLAQAEQARPGKYAIYTAQSLDDVRTLAHHHKADIQVVLLGASHSEDQAAAATLVMQQIWTETTVQLLKMPTKLATPEGKRGGMMRWFLEHIEGPIEGECGCC